MRILGIVAPGVALTGCAASREEVIAASASITSGKTSTSW
jgi:hypothetical protein